jgi:PAS domain S-box-containing protein
VRSAVNTTTILRNVHDAIIATDLQGKVLLSNPAVERIYGYTPGELKGRHIGMLYFPEDRQGLDDNLLNLVRTKSFLETRVRNRHKAGHGIVVDLRLAVLSDSHGREQGYIGCSNDITAKVLAEEELAAYRLELERRVQAKTRDLSQAIQDLTAEVAERRRVEEELRSSQKRLQHLMASVPGVIYSCAPNEPFDVAFVSNNVERIFGLLPEDVLRDPDCWLGRIHSEDRRECEGFVSRVLAEGTGTVDYRIIAENGAIRWVRDSASLIVKHDGTTSEIVGFCTDTTEIHAAQEALAQREKNRIASEALVRAQEAERRRIGRELHDTFIQMLGSFMFDLAVTREKIPTPYRVIRRELNDLRKRLGELCDSLGDVAHQLHSATLQHLGLKAALQHECELLTRQSGIHVECECSGNCHMVPESVALCIYRVVQESFRNISRHSRARRAKLAVHASSSGIRLCISDDGVGFRPQAKRSGTGLGIVSMAERVRLLHGTFDLKSAPAQGTEISATFPLEEVTNG